MHTACNDGIYTVGKVLKAALIAMALCNKYIQLYCCTSSAMWSGVNQPTSLQVSVWLATLLLSSRLCLHLKALRLSVRLQLTVVALVNW